MDVASCNFQNQLSVGLFLLFAAVMIFSEFPLDHVEVIDDIILELSNRNERLDSSELSLSSAFLYLPLCWIGSHLSAASVVLSSCMYACM